MRLNGVDGAPVRKTANDYYSVIMLRCGSSGGVPYLHADRWAVAR